MNAIYLQISKYEDKIKELKHSLFITIEQAVFNAFNEIDFENTVTKQAFCYFALQRFDYTASEIARHVGYADHTTISKASVRWMDKVECNEYANGLKLSDVHEQIKKSLS